MPEIFIPDKLDVETALARTTHLAIGAHQDDLEIMAIDGMARREPPSVYTERGVLVVSGSDEDEWERKAQEQPEKPDQPESEKPDIDAVHKQRYKSSED